MKNHDHWVPKFKHQLIDSLASRWPESRGRFGRMRIRQLYAIFFRMWGDAGHACCKG